MHAHFSIAPMSFTLSSDAIVDLIHERYEAGLRGTTVDMPCGSTVQDVVSMIRMIFRRYEEKHNKKLSMAHDEGFETGMQSLTFFVEGSTEEDTVNGESSTGSRQEA